MTRSAVRPARQRAALLFLLLTTTCLLVVGCAAPPPAPIKLNAGNKVRILLPNKDVIIRVAQTPVAFDGVIDSLVERGNRDNSAQMQESVRANQQYEPLGALFERLLRSHLEKSGLALVDGNQDVEIPTITLENLAAIYSAATMVSRYAPKAIVFVRASSDGPVRAGTTARTVLATLDGSTYTFGTADAIFADPSKAYAGLRAVTEELAVRVAKEISAAQRE